MNLAKASSVLLHHFLTARYRGMTRYELVAHALTGGDICADPRPHWRLQSSPF